jgi:hypothetical protein
MYSTQRTQKVYATFAGNQSQMALLWILDATASSVVHMQPRNASHLQNDPDFSSLTSYHHLPTRNTVDGRNPAPVGKR